MVKARREGDMIKKINFFNKIAWCFNTFMWFVRSTNKYAKAIILTANLKKNKSKYKILDIGGGTGSIARHLIPYSKEIIILDPAEAMLSKIKHPEIEKVQSTVQKMKFKKNYFDLIYCVDSFHHFTNGYAKQDYQKATEKAISNILSALKEKGSLIIIEFDTSRFPGKAAAFLENSILNLGSNFYSPKNFKNLWKHYSVKIFIKKLDFWCYIAKIRKIKTKEKKN